MGKLGRVLLAAGFAGIIASQAFAGQGCLSAEQARRRVLAAEIESTTRALGSGGSGTWTGFVDIYAWIPVSINGTSTIGTTTLPLDLDIDDVFDLFEFAASARVEGWKGRWGFMVDAMYVDLGLEGTLPGPLGASFDVDIQQWFVDFGGGYRAVVPEGKQQPWGVDLLVGGRYVDMKQEITISPAPAVGGNVNYVDLLFEGRVVYVLSDSWLLAFRFDFSGFDIGSGSDLTWNMLLGAGYRFGKRDQFAFKFGYRFMSLDYGRGGGTSRFAMDIEMHGPYLAFGFVF